MATPSKSAQTSAPVALVPSVSSPSALVALVASIAAWLDAVLTQYRGKGARDFFRAMLLASVSPMHVNVSVLGPPGGGKTAMATAFAKAFSETLCARTLSPWTTDAELLGQPDIGALTAGKLERAHDPNHPDLLTATMSLMDEWSRTVNGIRAMLLSAGADRITPTGDKVTSHVMVFASNMRLTSEDDQAANDRMALRIEMPRIMNADDLGAVMFRNVPVRDASGKCAAPTAKALPLIPPGAIATLRAHAATVEFPHDVYGALVAFALALRQPAPSGATFPDVSERRWVVAMSILQASAALRGADAVDWIDLTETLPLIYDEGEASRPALSAALSSSIPVWVSALQTLDAICKESVARAYRVASRNGTHKGDAEGDLNRDKEFDGALATLAPFGHDIVTRAKARVKQAREDIEDAEAQGKAEYAARVAANY